MRSYFSLFCTASILLLTVITNAEPQNGITTQGIPPKSPVDSLHCMQTHDELRVELVAAEPLVVDPVAIDFGADGRLWVAEMNDYGRGVYEEFEPKGRVRWLQDNDHDGQFDEAHTFVEGLRFPTDVKVWRDGILICDAPDILLATDNNGDGRADRIEKLFTGFEIRNAQARVNSLRFGLDNWLYGSCGLFGGKITSLRTGKTTDLTSRDFRMNPDSGEIEPVTGRTQQGRCRNDWGEWFGCSNGTLIRHYPVEDRYHRRNPLVAPPPTSVAVANGTDARRLIPSGELVKFELSGASGTPTSACGLGIYRDRLLGDEYTGNAFTCEPVHQLVHRLQLLPKDATFTGRRAENELDSEFLSSTDRWFRPVQARTGPDGAIWIVDMYRFVIEHGRWIPQETLKKVDVFAGKGRGRIYRVVPRREKGNSRKSPELDTLTSVELVQTLDLPNGTIRDLAHQLLLWRTDPTSIPALCKLLSEANSPQGQLHALCILDGLEALSADELLVGLKSDHSGVVRKAIQLSEKRLDSESLLFEAVTKLASHSSFHVRRQVAYSLGETSDSQAAKSLASILHSDSDEQYLRGAVLSSITSSNVASVLQSYQQMTNKHHPTVMTKLVSLTIQLGEVGDVTNALNAALHETETTSATSLRLLANAMDALDRRTDSITTKLNEEITTKLESSCQKALEVLSDSKASDSLHIAALNLVGRRSGSSTSKLLNKVAKGEELAEQIAELISARQSTEVQQAAVNTLARIGNKSTGSLLLTRWSSSGANVRNAILDVLLRRDEWTMLLLERVEDGIVKQSSFDVVRRQGLIEHEKSSIRELAKTLLQGGTSPSREAIIASYRSALSGERNTTHGRDVFRKRCASCHRLEEYGHVIGPDLQGLTNRSADWLLTTILDPNREVDARYVSWTAALEDGRVITGLIADESSSSIRFKEAEGKEHDVLRNEIEEIRSTERSLMPEGLERDISPREAADVIAYVTQFIKAPSSSETSTTSDAPLPRRAPEIALFLLDGSQSKERRQAVIDRRPGLGPAIMSLLVKDLKMGDKDEYERMPWIWRVAIAVGRRNDGGELRDLLDISLPQVDEPLQNWQAVVIGGGIINGITQIGQWPNERMREILAGVPNAAIRWSWALKLAATMADDKKVRVGTRYDALRMIALSDGSKNIEHLKRYLVEGVPDALQMGAISGLSDIQSEQVPAVLIDCLPKLSKRNRKLAVEGLLRTESRSLVWIHAIKNDHTDITNEEKEAILSHESPRVSAAAAKLFSELE